MEIETSSAIKLFFPNPSLALIYFEAIANALDAEATDIDIAISIQSFTASETLNITITDNGNGFTEESFERFKKLMKPKDGFHKGIGRLVFLNYFQSVAITSEWNGNRRKFIFKENFDGKSETEKTNDPIGKKTILVFKNFAKDKVKSYDDLRPGNLKEKIVSHFLLTLNDLRDRKLDFKIKISLETKESNSQKEFFSSDVIISSDDLPQMEHKVILDETLDAHSPIDMHYYVKTDTSASADLLTAVSIDGRTIPINLIQPSAIPYGNSAVFIFSSDLFSASADTSRQKLILSDGISENALNATLRREIGLILAKDIPEIANKNQKVEKKFEEQFPHLLGYFEPASVGLIDGEDALNNAQQKFFKVQKEILQCESMTDLIYEKSLEASARTLTEYILYREKIIAKMKAMTSDNTEDEIHNLIVPRWERFQQDAIVGDVYQNNAWLLDDKFMTFRTILSEKRMSEVINAIRLEGEDVSGETGRPDIAMIFSADPKDSVPVDVVVIEIKKKTDDEKENQYAINQLLERARKLVEHCPNIQRIWYYAVLQINDSFARSLRQQRWATLFSKGRLYYQEYSTERPDGTMVPTPIFAMSFDAIVSDAQSRNHTFLEILRSAMKQQSRKLADFHS
jgi:hypothetical protein